ncbi:hypothetical protein CFR74_13945 [Novacetimonas hansenii]|nr:hypothetical protein CFR74_13945 [Novacetimonas hansenii]
MRAFKPVKMRVKTINRSIFTEPVFGGNASGVTSAVVAPALPGQGQGQGCTHACPHMPPPPTDIMASRRP